MNKKYKIIILFFTIYLTLFCSAFTYATETKKCTHPVYSDGDKATYHYSYCSICRKCKSRTRHYSATKRNSGNSEYHKSYCYCGRDLGYESHSYYYEKISDNTHRGTCACGYSFVESHEWTGGNVSAHICVDCSFVHPKSKDATAGLHCFAIDKIRTLGDVAPCVVCGENLSLKFSADTVLDKLPKKEEYTMVGNPNPMKEKTISSNQKIISNFMPLNENGDLIKIDDIFLRVRSYTNGNYYRHYSKLAGAELDRVSQIVKFLGDGDEVAYIANELKRFDSLGGNNEAEKQRIVDDVTQRISDNANINFIDVMAVTNVVTKLGDFAINSINSPLINWFKNDSAIRNTWLGGSVTTIRQEFKGSRRSSSGREFILYFTELPPNKYEILTSPILTYGINFNILSYSVGGFTNMMFSTLFKIGGAGGDKPANILAYVSIAYRDNNGNVIYAKDGRLATPQDTVISRVVYSGTSPRTVAENITAQMDWTQLSGYRYKGYLLKYGNSSGGRYEIYNKPNEMTVTTESSVSVVSKFESSRMGASLVFYFEAVNIISVTHKVKDVAIKTQKNLGKMAMPSVTNYDVSARDFAPKTFASLNKNFWPGYILTGISVYGGTEEPENIILKKSFNVNTTTKIDSKNDAKRYIEIMTAMINYNGEYDKFKKEKLGYGKDKIIVFEYLYPEVEISNVDYKSQNILKDISNQLLTYKIKLIGDNMIVKSLDTSKPENKKYKELDITLSNGIKKNYKYDASDYSLVQAWIYTKDLKKNTKTLYKIIVGNNSFVPANIAKDKIMIVDNANDFANYYILSTNELLSVINRVWSDLYIEFRYVKGANSLNVSYIDEEGNTLMPAEIYKFLEEVNGNKQIVVPITYLDEYKLIRYELDGEKNSFNSDIDDVTVIGNGKDRELVFVYRKENSDIPPEESMIPMAIIKSNDRRDEEYDVEVAMPTDEDLYANVITDSYKIEEVVSILQEKQKVNVILKKKYYLSSDDDENKITSGIAIAKATTPVIYDLDYEYYGGGNARLFILDTAIIENDAVMDTKHYDKNGKVLIEADYNKKEPALTYTEGGKLFINNSEECTLIKDENGVYYLEVLLSGIDYEKPNMNQIASNYKNDHQVIDNIIKRNSLVNGDYLSVYAENREIIYLDGLEIFMSADRLPNISELIMVNYYFNNSKSPLTNENVLFNERNVYTFEKAKNQKYFTNKLTLNYVLSEYIANKDVNKILLKKFSSDELKNLAINSPNNNVSIYKNISGDCKRVKNYTPSEILMNDISIYTPIVNYTTLIPLNNSGENDNQLIDISKMNVLTLDSVFTIEIPHGGLHKYATKDDTSNYFGYGDKAYNYDGTMQKDEKSFSDKGLNRQRFAKMKLVKFDFDTYAIKYNKDGSVKDKKLILANSWFNLGELDKKTGLNIEKYNFIIPVWVKDNREGNISVRIVSSNIPDEFDIYTDKEIEYISKDVANKKDVYILQKDFEVYISGMVYDLEIRDSNDVGWQARLESLLKVGNSSMVKNLFLPIGQNNQNKINAYKYGLKFGYKFYFDLKTKGIANESIKIVPEFYYVPKEGGAATNNISIFYDTIDDKHVKLDDEHNINIMMKMSDTHGDVNNKDFTFELLRGKLFNPEISYVSDTLIGNMLKGLYLRAVNNKLPRNNILEASMLYGYGNDTAKFLNEAIRSESVESENSIMKAAGHWYGEFYLPIATRISYGKNTTAKDIIKDNSKLLKDGYLVVVFKEIKTFENTEEYLSYSQPADNSRWIKEGVNYEINLPNGEKCNLLDCEEGVGMAIYDVSLSIKDDYETQGTH